MTTTKKAQVEVSFNWIFVLIAGAVILFFFIRVINTELDTSDKISQSKAVSRINDVLSALQQNPDVVNKDYRIGYEINFECTIEGHTYGIRNSRDTLPYQVLFSPNTIGDSYLIYWVKKLQAPFPVSSTLYLTDEETKYIFLQGTDDDQNKRTKYYHDLLPNNMSKSLISLNEFKNQRAEDYRKYIIITTDKEQVGESFGFETNSKLPSKIKYVLYINENAKQIEFYELEPSQTALKEDPETKPYFTEETILGAIISGNPDLYECAMEKLLHQVRIATDINLERIKSIHEYYGDSSCASHFAAPTQRYFEELSQSASKASDELSNDNFEDLHENHENIEIINEKLTKTNCVTIY